MKQIYLHGLGQSPESWSKVIEQLEAVEHSMCPDLSKLVQGQDTTYQNLYAAFSAMCDAIEEDICLCGLSLGGVLALNYAICDISDYAKIYVSTNGIWEIGFSQTM